MYLKTLYKVIFAVKCTKEFIVHSAYLETLHIIYTINKQIFMHLYSH